MPLKKAYIAIHNNHPKFGTNPISHDGQLGPYYPVYDNPLSAMEWAESTRYVNAFCVIELHVGYGEIVYSTTNPENRSKIDLEK